MKSYGKILIMDDRFFNSAFVQLFVFENGGGLFEPVILNPFVKVYKIKKD
jgi:dolichyl-diphosphooligosaccharide--protein glycosyltransferase/undecaprenyl-diphosphooligosaccharide--protein glycosyltransferase